MLWTLLVVLLWLSLGASSGSAVAAAFLAPPSPIIRTRIPGRAEEDRGSHHTLAAETAAQQQHEFALLFDCDGVILETEELHRLAYNEAFREFDLTINGEPVVWSVRTYVRRDTCYALLLGNLKSGCHDLGDVVCVV